MLNGRLFGKGWNLNFRLGGQKSGFQIGQRHLSRTQFAAQISIPAFRHGFDRFGGFGGFGSFDDPALGCILKPADQLIIFAGGFIAGLFDIAENDLDLIDRLQNQGNHGRRYGEVTIAEFAKQSFAGMGHRFKPRQAEETTSPLHRVQEPEDIVENCPIFRIVFETDELRIDDVKAFASLRQEFTDQIVHCQPLAVDMPVRA